MSWADISGKWTVGLKNAHSARILSKWGKDEARQAWQGLIEQNPDCYDYYNGYLSCRGIDLGEHGTQRSLASYTERFVAEALTEETRSQALQSLKDFSQQFPRASAPLRITLDVALGSPFNLSLSCIQD